MTPIRWACLLTLLGTTAFLPRYVHAADAARSYYAYVTCESEDEVTVVRFKPGPAPAAEVVKRIGVGVLPTEIEGPHGVCVSPDGKHWFLSMAHGIPFGRVYKYTTADDRIVGQTELGLFPATMQVSSATGLLYVVNFNLHGDRVPSSVSVVEPEEMIEIRRITTGVMPHGSRLSPDGRRHYSCAMMSNKLYEIDALKLNIRRELALESAAKGKMAMPTWVQLHPKKPLAYVAFNGSDEIAEVDLDGWKVARRLKPEKMPAATGAANTDTLGPKKLAPYNVEVTPDGTKLVVTYKAAAATGFWDLDTGEELARAANSRTVSHGIAITPDSRYCFVTAEGTGSQPGSVDVFDLTTFQRVATADVGKQAGGIAFWKMVEAP